MLPGHEAIGGFLVGVHPHIQQAAQEQETAPCPILVRLRHMIPRPHKALANGVVPDGGGEIDAIGVNGICEIHVRPPVQQQVGHLQVVALDGHRQGRLPSSFLGGALARQEIRSGFLSRMAATSSRLPRRIMVNSFFMSAPPSCQIDTNKVYHQHARYSNSL